MANFRIHTTVVFIFLAGLLCYKTAAQSLDSLKLAYQRLPDYKRNNPEDTTSCYLLAMTLEYCDDKEVGDYARSLREISEDHLARIPANDPLVKTYKTYFAIALNDLGTYSRDQGDVVKALDYLHQGLIIHEKLNHNYQTGQMYNNIAAVYYDIGDKAKALEYFEKGYAVLKDIGDFNHLAPLLINLGFISFTNNKFTEALKYYKLCEDLATKQKDKRYMAKSINGEGLILSEQGHYEEALEHFHKSLILNKEINNTKNISDILINIGDCYIAQKMYREALPHSEKAYHIGQQQKSIVTIRQAAASLKKIYEHLGKYKQALSMYEQYIQLRDSTNNEKNRQAALSRQLQYEYDKKEIILKEGHARLEKLYEQKQKFYFILGIVLVVLILIIFCSLYLWYRFKKEKESKNLHIELKERLKQEIKEKESIANSLLYIQEHERAKLAAELHDGVNQLLFAAKMQLQASKSVEEDMHKEAVNLVDTAINEIKSIAANEGSFLLKDKQLKDALTDLILQMKRSQAINISFLNYGFDEDRLNQEQKTNILRIIQELLSNAMKHAGAENIYISIKTTNDKVLFAVTDVGKGIDVSSMRDGNGLKNISNKVALMKGMQRIVSVAGRGTKVFIIIPLT